MRKRLLFLAVTTVLLLSLTSCDRSGEAKQMPDVDFFIEYASERFGVPAEEISVVSFKKGTWSQDYNIYTFDYYPVQFHFPVARLEWGGKTVKFFYFPYGGVLDYYDTSCLRDDYYYDELYEAVQQYFRDRLEVEDVIVGVGETTNTSDDGNYGFWGIADYLKKIKVAEVSTGEVEKLLYIFSRNFSTGKRYDQSAEEEIVLFAELKGDDPEAEIRTLIDSLAAMDLWVRVDVMSRLDGVEAYRGAYSEEVDYYLEQFDIFHIDGLDYENDCLASIERAEAEDDADDLWVEYKGYRYLRRYLPQAQEQVDAEGGEESDASGEEPVAPEQTDAENDEEAVQAGE